MLNIVFVLTDRDSSAWNMDDKSVQRRRNLFWEIFILEMMHVRVCTRGCSQFIIDIQQSVALGRPPSVSLNHVDCQLPTDDESSGNTLQECRFSSTSCDVSHTD